MTAVIVATNIIQKYQVYTYTVIRYACNIIGQSNVINSKSCKGGGLRRRPTVCRTIRCLIILLFIVKIHTYLVCNLPTCIRFIIYGAQLQNLYEI